MQSYYSMSTLHRHPQTPTLPNNGYNQPNPNPNPNPAYYASLPRHLSHPHLNRIPESGGPSGQGQTPVIFNVFAQNGDLQAVHYGTLPLRPSGNGAANLKRSGSTKSIGATSNTSTLKKSTPGANQILKWIQNQKAKFKSSKSSRSSVVSANSGTLKPPPKNGILRDSGRRSAQPPPVTMPRHDYSQYVGSLPRDWHSYRQHSAPPAMNQAYRGPPQPQPRDSMAYPTRYDYRDRDYDERPDGSYQTYAADYYPTGYRPYEQRPASHADYSYRSRSIDAPMAHRYPVEPPIDYSLSNSENDSSLEDITTATSATRVRFQVPRQQDIQYIDTTHQAPTPRETMSPIQKFEKIYEKFKPSKLANFMPKNKAKQKGVYSPEAVEAQHWHEETVCTDISIAKSIKEDSAFSEEVVPVQNKLAIRGDTVSIASSMTLTSLNGADNDDSGNGADQESNDGEAETNVFFFGSMRIDYMCRRVGDNVVVHYTSRNIAGPGGNVGGQIEGVFTDIEYGPGIVQKLREKFSKLATTAIETAQISPHARQKKFPSVDDILSEGEQRGFVEMKQRSDSHSHSHAISTSVPPAPKKAFLPPLPAAAPPPPPPPPPPQNNDLDQSETTDEESTSVAAVAPPLPEKRIDSPRSVVEESHIETISALRAKFEQQSRATTSSIRGGPTSLNLVRKSASRDDVLLYSTRSAPPPGTTEDQAESLSPPRPPKQIYTSKSDILKGSAPKPVRVLDLVSPPADPAPKGNGTETYTRGISPTSSVADSDQSPPPEEPKFKPYDDEDEEYDVDSDVSDAGEAKGYDLIEAQDKFSNQYSHDERTEERVYFQTQKSKMTLTLPIGSTEVQSKQSTTQDVRIGVPGSTPISGTGKLKVANSASLDSNEGLSEVQRLLSKFNSMREQKVTSESETVEVNSPKQPPAHYLPTAIVPPVQSTTAQSTPPVTTASTGRFAWASPAPAVTTTSVTHSRVESDDSQWSSRHNIVSITVGEQRHGFEDLDESAPTSSQSSALRAPPVAPPPLPPRGGTEQQQAQRKSLTQRWLESKSGPAHPGNPADASSDDSDADSTLDRRHNEPAYGSTGAYSKPYGDDEIIESDSGHRRSIDLTGIQEETEEDMAHETPTVRLLSRRTIEDDGGVVSRSDFLKGNPPYDSSESDEDDYAQNHHQMSYRMGFYDRTTASDGNPVRHSLLNLVEEEDIPELLQAMAEECHFVFDDCDDNRPTTSGIIHAPAKRIERRKARNVNRIRFEEVPPSVFAYVDENTAYEEGEWSDGCRISYDEYRNIVDAAAEEAAQQQMDLANWRLAMEQKYAAEAEQREATGAMIAQVVPPRASDAELGVTSTFSYTAPPTTPPPASVASMMGLRPAATS